MRSPAVNHTSPRQPAIIAHPRQHQRGPNVSSEGHKSTICFRAAMVKLGSNLSEKAEKLPSPDDGFDNIPLITPLEVNQLQQPFADKVIVKTSTHYQLQRKKNKLYMPNIKKLNINLYSDFSEKAKITGLILITLAFLTSLLLLLMYKAMWYNRLTCPEGFILKQKHCTPASLEMYRTQQQLLQLQKDDPDRLGNTNTNCIYASLLHRNQVKRTWTEMPSPWLPVISALKEAKMAKQGGARLRGVPEGEE